jgi:hypothetical protein
MCVTPRVTPIVSISNLFRVGFTAVVGVLLQQHVGMGVTPRVAPMVSRYNPFKIGFTAVIGVLLQQHVGMGVTPRVAPMVRICGFSSTIELTLFFSKP